MDLYLDIETYSSEDLKTSGVYRYCESIDFQILMVAYAFDNEPVQIVDLAAGERLPLMVILAMRNPDVKKHAHNAAFERICFRAYGIDIPADQWYCSAVKSAYCGLPLSLEAVSNALELFENGKSAEGKALIKFFSMPVAKPIKRNNFKARNFWYDDPEKWQKFKDYCIQDVEAERNVIAILKPYEIPQFERDLYILDQKINDAGIMIDTAMAKNLYTLDTAHVEILLNEFRELTGIENPKSVAQIKRWLFEEHDLEVKSLGKESIPKIIKKAGPGIIESALNLRSKTSKSSTKKYTAMLNCVCSDARARGLLQFYGAMRTGRWAGRLVQMQNLPKNFIDNILFVRSLFSTLDYESIKLLYDDIPTLISQLIRTTFKAKDGHLFAVADFSAIEARVLAWLSNEAWRMEVFRTHGKVYEASAAAMFGVSMETIINEPGKHIRSKGKIAELALGYGGSVGALKKMGGEKMGLSEAEMKVIVTKWRKANPKIVNLWYECEKYAIIAFKQKKYVQTPFRGLGFSCDSDFFKLHLPSGRCLMYYRPAMKENKFGRMSLSYMGMNQDTKKWERVDTYGGKIVENATQAIARDLLANTLIELDKFGFNIVLHVHDESIAEIPDGDTQYTENNMKTIMERDVSWAPGLPIKADTFSTKYYKKED